VLSMLGVLVMTVLLWRYQKTRSLYGDEGNG
jgi:hypothetical protein